jgi:branched-chain amino acid aminotransferase
MERQKTPEKGRRMTVIWKDGHFLDGINAHIMHNDTGFQNGLGVFDTMLARRGVLENPDLHFERLLHDCDVVLGYGASWIPSFADMTNIWLPLLAHNNLSQGFARIKTIITGGVSDTPLQISPVPSIVVMARTCADPATIAPAACVVVRNFPRIAGDVFENCKRLDYTRNFAARRMARAAGADEAILLNTQGTIACAATSNVFIEENGALFTPPLHDGALAGTVRKKLLMDGRAKEDTISVERLEKASGVYLTNSLAPWRAATLK